MSGPTVPTVKRLFAVSGNVCAFPKCKIPLVDESSGKVTGKICHIKGRNPGAKRYDNDQTDEERHSFDNLILLCPIHHDVIDSDEIAYTVQRLHDMKAAHESLHSGGNEPTDEIASNLILNIEHNTIIDGSIIISNNQMGGQIAHSIVNVGTQSRVIEQAAANALIAELMKYPNEDFDILSIFDAESVNLRESLERILELAGWKSKMAGIGIFISQPHHVMIAVPEVKKSYEILYYWMENIGLKPDSGRDPKLERIRITIGSHL